MAVCTVTPEEALADAKCFGCLTPYQLQQVIASLLCKVIQELNPMAECDVDTLLADSNCFTCLSAYQLQQITAQLLCELRDTIGGGISGVTGVFCGAGAPVANPGVTCAMYYDTATGNLYYWNSGTSAWVALIAS